MDKEQSTKILFEEVKQELDRQMHSYKTEINDRLQVHVPAGDEAELKEFINNQKQYYEDFFSDEWGRPTVKKFSWERYQQFINDLWEIGEIEAKLRDEQRKKDLIHHHAQQFLYGEIISYLNSLAYDRKDLPDWEEKKHEVIIRYEKLGRKGYKDKTSLTLKESIALYDILKEFKIFLGISESRPISNIAASICLATGYEKDSIEKEINNVTPQDYQAAFKKLQEIASKYSPPSK